MSSALACFEAPSSSTFGRFGGRSITVRPGEAATPASFIHAAEREEILKLVRQLSIDGLSWSQGKSANISELTHQTATKFFRTLPAGKAFPKISPDGEGGLMMVWEGKSLLILTVDDLKVHMVKDATTPHADYLNDVVLGELIDGRILDVIPAR